MPSSPPTEKRPRLALWIEYPILQHGGTEVLVRELIAGLSPQFRLTLLSDDKPDILEHPLLRGRVEKHFHWSAANVTPDLSIHAVDQLIRSGIDLVHLHFGGNFAFGVRRVNVCPSVHLHRRGVPCLATNHGVFGVLEGYIGAHRSLLTKLALLPAAWVGKMQTVRSVATEIAVSDNDCRALRRRYWPLASKFRRIYHSRIAESESVPDLVREKVIFCAGTVGVRKGQPFLARAFLEIAEKIPDWRLVFAGRPGQEETVTELRSLIARMPHRIEWLTECSDAELKQWLQRSEIFAMPSLHEGLGLSLQEALYYGCACVASRAGGIQDLVTNGENGLLVPPTDVPALSQALLRLTTDDSLRSRFQERGRASILEKDMTSERMTRNYIALYHAILSKAGRSGGNR